MNIIYYHWNELTAADIKDVFEELQYHVYPTTSLLSDYTDAAQCPAIFDPIMHRHPADCIFSFNYFPAIAQYCHDKKIPYISWVYDCPHLTLYSKTVCFPEVYLHIFDKDLCRIPLALGAGNVFHTPLAVRNIRLQDTVRKFSSYNYDVSFVGSLYLNNQFDQIAYLPDYISGYLSGLMTSQQRIWGYDLIADTLSDQIVSEMNRYVSLGLSPEFAFTPKDIFRNMILQKVTSLDRIGLLTQIAEHFSLSLFSNPGDSYPKPLRNLGYISYTDEMPQVFRTSRINLNISLRSITSGIPLRALDIMGAGGFLLSNYQPELAEFFVPGEDFVYFENAQDLLEKCAYYLTHEKEREAIAENGCRKVQTNHDYTAAVSNIFSHLTD